MQNGKVLLNEELKRTVSHSLFMLLGMCFKFRAQT